MARTPPGFFVFADDELAAQMGWTDAEVAAYWRLKLLQASRGPIGPIEERAAGDPEAVALVLERVFAQGDAGWYHPGLADSLEQAEAKRASRSAAGKKGGRPPKQTESNGFTGGNQKVSKRKSRRKAAESYPGLDPGPGPGLTEPSPTSAKPTAPSQADGDPKFPVYPCVGGRTSEAKTWTLSESMIELMAESFPGLDVRAEAIRAHGWTIVNRKKRKTAAGMDRFLWSWMERNQNRAGGQAAAPQSESVF